MLKWFHICTLVQLSPSGRVRHFMTNFGHEPLDLGMALWSLAILAVRLLKVSSRLLRSVIVGKPGDFAAASEAVAESAISRLGTGDLLNGGRWRKMNAWRWRTGYARVLLNNSLWWLRFVRRFRHWGILLLGLWFKWLKIGSMYVMCGLSAFSHVG